MASAEGTAAEARDQGGTCPAGAYPLENLACQDAVLAGVHVLLVMDHTLVGEQGSHRVQLGLVGDPGQAQSLAEVGMPEGDDHQGREHQVVRDVLVGHGRGAAVVGVLDVAGQLD